MPPNIKRVFYVNNVAAPVFLDMLATRPDIQVDRLANDTPDAEAEPVLARAHAYQIGSSRQELAMRFQGFAPLLRRCPNLLLLSTTGAGFDTLGLADATEAGIAVVNQAGGNKEGVAEHVLGMMLALSKRIVTANVIMRRGTPYHRRDFMGDDILGRSIGIIGIGHVGTRLAELCRGLFRMRVLAYDPYLTAEQIAARGGEKVETLEDLLRQSDFVSVNCPHTAETRGMLGAGQFAQMQPHAYFITTARGGIHDEAALAAALAAKQLSGAGLDVWEEEPPPPDHPLMGFDNVVVSPHNAGVTRQSRHTIAKIAAEQLLDMLDGKKPPRLLNPEVWPVYRERFARILGVMPEA
ncbi:NAD(P)-dependent oxidoreductase [Rhodopila globiformis]|uniref:3-phosphoglycerate dehydrogenase n=1 Tax=Rhodopila globiformis TaxID=1071 RepID=A0A2S6NIZ7_RHOGL|nr:NAD(P)-dependent oxidoreductase [Rhodopila globiformis]PPQ34635.1 3-phosphoglycerate dehydrogenase [Rhodopila globiformis]